MRADQIVEARSLAAPVGHSQTAADKTPMIVIQYVPTLGDSGTTASISVTTAATIVFKVDDSAAVDNDTLYQNGTATSTLVITEGYTTCDTMGELVDTINGAKAWRAYLVAALRSDPVCILITTSSSAAHGANGLTIYGDASAVTGGTATIGPGIAISGEKFVNNGKNGHVKDWEDRCENSLLYAAVSVGMTSVNTGVTLKYYSGRAGYAETQIGSSVVITAETRKEQGEANLNDVFVQAVLGHRLICRVELATGTCDTNSIDVQYVGKTAVFANDRIVNEDNY